MDKPIPAVKIRNNGLVSYIDENKDNKKFATLIGDSFDVATLDFRPTVDQNQDGESADKWFEEEIRYLLKFYTDHKDIFKGDNIKKHDLWSIACKTILLDKTPSKCQTKFRNLKNKYKLIQKELAKNDEATVHWSYYNLCHHTFRDDVTIDRDRCGCSECIRAAQEEAASVSKTGNVMKSTAGDSNSFIEILSKSSMSQAYPDERVARMLKLYLEHKNSSKDKWHDHCFWDGVAAELGENAEYWYRRFVHLKRYYIRMVNKRKTTPGRVFWPYIDIFDEIFGNDPEFQKKLLDNPILNSKVSPNPALSLLDWHETDKTILVKFYLDYFEEFHEKTIPKRFLWNKIARLLHKTDNDCIQKFEELKEAHLDLYMRGVYDLQNRKPLSSLLDTVISREVGLELSKTLKITEKFPSWTAEELDELVQYFHDNILVFKDPICHNVCWHVISKKLKKNVQDCRRNWKDLTRLYKRLLEDKKEDPDMQIDWRYLKLFNNIFDYGMDTRLLVGYDRDLKCIPKNVNAKQKRSSSSLYIFVFFLFLISLLIVLLIYSNALPWINSTISEIKYTILG